MQGWLYADAMGNNYAYRLIMAAYRLPDALAALGTLAAPEPLGPTVVRFPGRELELPFSSNFRTGKLDVVPGGDHAAFEAALWFGLDHALEAFLEDDPDALELARIKGGSGVGYVYVYVSPATDLEDSLSELSLVAASSSISELFHQSASFRMSLTTLLERVGARAGLLDMEGDLHLVFWMDGERFREPVAVADHYGSLCELRRAVDLVRQR